MGFISRDDWSEAVRIIENVRRGEILASKVALSFFYLVVQLSFYGMCLTFVQLRMKDH